MALGNHLCEELSPRPDNPFGKRQAWILKRFQQILQQGAPLGERFVEQGTAPVVQQIEEDVRHRRLPAGERDLQGTGQWVPAEDGIQIGSTPTEHDQLTVNQSA